MQTLAVATMTENEIRQVLDTRVAALRTKDAERYIAHYAPDVVTFELAPPLRNAGSDARSTAGLDSWFETWDGPIVQEITQFDATVAEEDGIAFCHGLVHMAGTKVGGTAVDLWFRSTWCLRRIDHEWKIAHEHNSTPFYMDGSDRAALDLTP